MTSPPLIFIIGSHRSGTSVLYHLLAKTGQIDYLSTSEILEFQHKLLNFSEPKEKSLVFQDRELDALPVDDNTPEEFGFLLKTKAFLEPKLTKENIPLFNQLLNLKSERNPGEMPFVLKEPSEFYRGWCHIWENYPNAKFLFIHRHPINVLASQIKSWSQSLKSKNKYFYRIDPFYRDLFNDDKKRLAHYHFFSSDAGINWIMEKLRKSYDYFLENISKLPNSSKFEFCYESLCQNTKECTKDIFDFIEISPNTFEDDFIIKRPTNIPEKIQSLAKEKNFPPQPYLDYLKSLARTER